MAELIDTGSVRAGAPSSSFMLKILEHPELLYEMLQRNGFILPDYKSALCNHQFLLDVKQGRVFCFREQDVSFKNMVHKLTTKDLNTRLRDKLEASLLMHDYWKNPENKRKV